MVAASTLLGLGEANADSEPPSSSPEYSTAIALGLPLAATTASVAVVALSAQLSNETILTAGLVGGVLSPSLGHIYTGSWKPALAGIGIRLVAGAVAAYGFGGALSDEDGSSDNSATYYVVGSIVFTASAVYELIDSPASAKRANHKQSRLSLQPTPLLGPERSLGWGGALRISL